MTSTTEHDYKQGVVKTRKQAENDLRRAQQRVARLVAMLDEEKRRRIEADAEVKRLKRLCAALRELAPVG